MYIDSVLICWLDSVLSYVLTKLFLFFMDSCVKKAHGPCIIGVHKLKYIVSSCPIKTLCIFLGIKIPRGRLYSKQIFSSTDWDYFDICYNRSYIPDRHKNVYLASSLVCSIRISGRHTASWFKSGNSQCALQLIPSHLQTQTGDEVPWLLTFLLETKILFCSPPHSLL